MTPSFMYFFCSLLVTFIFVFENSQNSVSYGPLFGPFSSVKCLNFGQKLPIRTAHHIFLKSRHPEVSKNPHHVFPSMGSRKRYQLMDHKDGFKRTFGILLFNHLYNIISPLPKYLWPSNLAG